MDELQLRALIDDVRAGRRTPDDLVHAVRQAPTADLGFALVDRDRALRQGMPEAVYAPGKTPQQCAAIVAELLSEGGPVVLSRASAEQRDACISAHPGGVVTPTAELSTVVWNAAPLRDRRVVVACAGTADLPVAHECAATLRAYGLGATLIADCGVAGLHRLLARLDALTDAHAVVAVAGMEGALASVIGGLTAAPVIAVPTSVGYGSSLQGVTALLAMLSSCAAGITVVGIDNGYGAACAVARLLPSAVPLEGSSS
jgi:pyridinium-3,5-biscarboxylic acid mononucleotide synthase